MYGYFHRAFCCLSVYLFIYISIFFFSYTAVMLFADRLPTCLFFTNSWVLSCFPLLKNESLTREWSKHWIDNLVKNIKVKNLHRFIFLSRSVFPRSGRRNVSSFCLYCRGIHRAATEAARGTPRPQHQSFFYIIETVRGKLSTWMMARNSCFWYHTFFFISIYIEKLYKKCDNQVFSSLQASDEKKKKCGTKTFYLYTTGTRHRRHFIPFYSEKFMIYLQIKWT